MSIFSLISTDFMTKNIFHNFQKTIGFILEGSKLLLLNAVWPWSKVGKASVPKNQNSYYE